jgi:EmrB/QacA subfamily drug resistance transporter
MTESNISAGDALGMGDPIGSAAGEGSRGRSHSRRAQADRPATGEERGGMRRTFGFVAICLAMFVVMLDTTITNIALPDIMDAFHSTLNDTSWISTIYVLGVSVLIIPLTRIADQFGRKKVLTIGFVLFGVGSALCGAAGSLPVLIAMRFLQSVGGSIVLPLAVPMGLVMFGKDRMQAISGIVGATTAVAAAGGPAVGGLLIQWAGWRSIFYLNVPFIVIAIALTLLCVDESYDDTASKRIDVFGMVFLASSLFLLTFALLKGEDFGWTSPTIVTMLVGSVAGFVAFVVTELHVKAPMMDFGLFREMTFTSSAVSYFIGGFAVVSPTLILNYFLQNVLSYTALNAALITMWASATVVVSMPLGNVIVGKIGDARAVNVLGLLFLSCGLFVMARTSVDTSKAAMIADMVVMGFGLGFSAQAIITSVKHLPVEKSGMASGIINSMRQIGTCLGIAILVSILDANVTVARNDIRTFALNSVSQSTLARPVKDAASRDVRNLLSASSASHSTAGGSSSRASLSAGLASSVAGLQSTPVPSDGTLRKVYQGGEKLGSAATGLADGQSRLAGGASTLSGGLSALSRGSSSLSRGIGTAGAGASRLGSGIDAYVAGVDSAAAGASTLNTKASGALDSLASGSSSLSAGAQRLLAQMGPGTSSAPTLRSGASSLASGSAALSQSMKQYADASTELYYTMISTNPNAKQLLGTYTAELTAVRASCAHASGSALVACQQRSAALTNLVAMYEAGTDSQVTNASQFAAALDAAQPDNLVSAGSSLGTAAGTVANGASSLSQQFQPEGEFYQGVAGLAQGAGRLDAGASQARDQLHAGTSELSDGLGRLQRAGGAVRAGSGSLSSGLANLAHGSDALGSGLASAQRGSQKLAAGSDAAARGGRALSEGTGSLTNGIGKIDQAKTLNAVFDSISSTKDRDVSHAFDKVFTIAAIVLGLSSVVGVFTDRRDRETPTSSR